MDGRCCFLKSQFTIESIASLHCQTPQCLNAIMNISWRPVYTHSYSLSYFSNLQTICMILFGAIFLPFSIFFPTFYLHIVRFFFSLQKIASVWKIVLSWVKWSESTNCNLVLSEGRSNYPAGAGEYKHFHFGQCWSVFLQVHHFGKLLAQLICNCHGNVIFPSSKPITGTW